MKGSQTGEAKKADDFEGVAEIEAMGKIDLVRVHPRKREMSAVRNGRVSIRLPLQSS